MPIYSYETLASVSVEAVNEVEANKALQEALLQDISVPYNRADVRVFVEQPLNTPNLIDIDIQDIN